LNANRMVRCALLPLVLVLWFGGAGCGHKDLGEETVATVNGEAITVRELREFLGVRGTGATASGIPLERKKEALDRLIGGRLLAAKARSLGLDNTEEFRGGADRNAQGVLITALFRKQVAGMKHSADEVKAEAKRMRAADNTLAEEVANTRAAQVVTQKELRKLEEELIAAAKKEFPPAVDNTLLQNLSAGRTVPDNAALAVVAGQTVTYGEVKGLLAGMPGGMHGNQDLSRNPVVISRLLERETTGKALAAYAKKQGIEGSEWKRQVQSDMERSILIDLVAEREVLKGIEVTDKEAKASYDEHAQMFVRNGKKIPFAQVKDQIRQFLENEKRKKALEDYIAGMRKDGKVTVNEALLPKV